LYSDSTLKTYLETTSAVNNQSLITAEWNLNIATNIDTIGNYTYDPATSSTIATTFISGDSSYVGKTDSSVSIAGPLNDDDSVNSFTSQSLRKTLLFSLNDCFNRFRPRSGINKMIYRDNQYFNATQVVGGNIVNRPRYYPAHKDDKFKYWTSSRTLGTGTATIEKGISKLNTSDSKIYITDTAPFIVYKNMVPANRIILKIQTNVGEIEATYKNKNGETFSDPFYGNSNKTVPLKWQVQYLDSSNYWQTLKSFDDTTPIFGYDGYLELAYGVTNLSSNLPSLVSLSQIYYAGEYTDSALLPTQSINGYTYLITAGSDAGKYAIWHDSGTPGYTLFMPTYGWYTKSETDNNLLAYMTDLTSPPLVVGSTIQYRDFQYVKGLRIVVDTMNKVDSSFDLIELSPRLAVNLTDKVVSFDVKKNASDIGNTGIPVGQLLASTGTAELFDYDLAFSDYNVASILNLKDVDGKTVDSISGKNLQVKIFELFYDTTNTVHIVPIKTLYSEGFPKTKISDRSFSLNLRDFYFYFESLIAPELLVVNQYYSYVVSMLLDSIGFTNYKFYRTTGEKDPVIPYFYVSPNTSVAQVLSDIAVSTQTAMFFDENNNLILMSKDYLMSTSRSVDINLMGSQDAIKQDVHNNSRNGSQLANVIEIASELRDVFNDGKITYNSKYIQKSTGTLAQQSLADIDRTWIYKPVLLWEVAPSQTTKSINDEIGTQSQYSLSAMALNSDLPDTLPQVVGGVIKYNEIDFGESIYWISRYNGYFHANGEIIRYDAVQYNVTGTGNVWITSVQEYQKYFAEIPFNGKLYPTGKVRIYSEPYYDTKTNTLKEGSVAKHGRGQFGTNRVSHPAGLDTYWTNRDNIKVIKFSSTEKSVAQGGVTSGVANSAAGVDSSDSNKAKVQYALKNILSSTFFDENASNSNRSVQAGSVQSSALILKGSTNLKNPFNYVSYISYNPNGKYNHFGTRVRVVGETSSDAKKRIQTPVGSTPYYTVDGKVIGGAGGGLGVMVDTTTNNGYFFEITALTDTSINAYDGNSASTPTYTVFFYKVEKSSSNSDAVPIVLYKGEMPIMTDTGTFAGQGRVYAEKNVTVYDLAIEYEKTTFGFRFHLFINNKYIAAVDDTAPLKEKKNVALFVRGSSKLMFENLYAIGSNFSSNQSNLNNPPLINTEAQSSVDSMKRYSINSAMTSTYLSSIGISDETKYNMYYNEFGTIMREAAYFNIKYDKAYPALYSKIAPTFNAIQGYSVAGFTPGSYGAEFMVFNTTDTVLNLDDTSGNYLRILGISFTQQSSHELSLDEYFNKVGDLSNPQLDNGTYLNPINNKTYTDIKVSRLTYGTKAFAINGPFIQNQDAAEELMSWMVSKITKPRRSVGVKIFANPMIQLGDMVTIDYTDTDGNIIFSSTSTSSSYTKFVVYSIEYSKSVDGPAMIIYLSEVV
jgi:hypothetical protein